MTTMRSLKTKIFLLLILPFVIIGGISFLFASIYLRITFEKNLEQSALVDTERIEIAIRDATLSKDVPQLTQMLLDERYSKTPSVSLTVFDPSGNVLAYTSLSAKPAPITIDSSEIITRSTDGGAYTAHTFTIDRTIVAGPHPIGMLRVTYDFTGILSVFDRAIYILLTISALGILLISLLATRLSQTVIDPIIELSQIATDFSQGNLSERAPIKGSKETADLANSFNAMARSIEQSQQDLMRKKDVLEQKVSELEAWKKATIGRELKMIEMKEALKKQP